MKNLNIKPRQDVGIMLLHLSLQVLQEENFVGFDGPAVLVLASRKILDVNLRNLVRIRALCENFTPENLEKNQLACT